MESAAEGGDISYIRTHEGWLYLAVILDLHSRRVVGWAVSDRMKKDLAIRALDMAVNLRKPPKDCIFHSDRGSRDVLQITEGRDDLAAALAYAATNRSRHLPVHQ